MNHIWITVVACCVSACAGAMGMAFVGCSDIDRRIARAYHGGYKDGYEAGKYDTEAGRG